MNHILKPKTEFLFGDIHDKLSKIYDRINQNQNDNKSNKKSDNDYEIATDYEPELSLINSLLPRAIPISQIVIKLGSPWIPTSFYEQFCQEVLDTKVKFFYCYLNNSWEVRKSKRNVSIANENWGWKIEDWEHDYYKVKGFPAIGEDIASGLFTLALEETLPKVKVKLNRSDRYIIHHDYTRQAISKQNQLKRKFVSWCRQDNRRAKQLEEIYNSKINRSVLINWDGEGVKYLSPARHSILQDSGMNPAWIKRLRNYQLDAIWRFVHTGGILGLEVGLGKTAVLIASLMLRKYYGICSKGMIVVQRATLNQFYDTFLEMYPQAKVLCILPENFTQESKNAVLAKILYQQWDGIILVHESFESIPSAFSTQRNILEREKKKLNREVNRLRLLGESSLTIGRKKGNRIIKKLLNLEKNLDKEIEELNQEERFNSLSFGLCWEDLEIDYLIIDEIQRFKNNLVKTSLSSKISGLSVKPSGRAGDFDLKSFWLRQKYGSKVLVGSTGTVEPTNSILGVFVFQSYFQAEELAKRGIENFDTWVGYFGEIKGVVEPKIDGKWRVTQRLTDFINVAELAILWFSCVHYKRYQMVKEDFTKEDSRPLPEYVTVSNQMCDYQKKKMQEISDRYHALRNLEPWYFPQLDKQGYVLDKNGDRLTNPQTNKGIKDLSEAIALNLDPNYKIDNFLLLSGDSRRLMICPQLLEPSLPVDPNSKIIKIADNVIDIYKKNNQDRSTQVIFLDIGTPGGSSKFPLYQWFKDYFIAKAIPESEIAFLQDYKTPEAKEELFADFNEGKVRILLTSIEAGGIGVNIQKRLLAIHLANFPYRPDLIEQAEGRGLRSGNIHEKVYIYRYITEGSKSAHGADTVILQFLQTKQLLRDRFFNCDRSLRKISENDSAAELYMLLKAESTGDPNVIRYTELEVELEEKTVELALAQGELNRLNSTNSGSIEHTEKIIAMSRSRVLQIQQDIDRINSYDLYPYFACYLKETQELVIGIELVYPETKSDTEQPQYDHCPYPKNSDIVELQALFASAIGVDDGNKLILMPIAKAEAYVAQELIKTCLKNQEVLSQLEESRNRYLDLGFYSGFNLSATFWSNKNSSHLSLSLTGSFEWAIAFRKTPTLFIEKLKEIKSTIAEDQNIWRDHDRNNQNILEKMELRKVELQGQIKEFERQINDLEVEKSNLVKNLNIDDLL